MDKRETLTPEHTLFTLPCIVCGNTPSDVLVNNDPFCKACDAICTKTERAVRRLKV